MKARALVALLLPGAASRPSAADFEADAVALDALIREDYAYLYRLPGGALADSAPLRGERASVHDAPGERVQLDLTDTPRGRNTSVARAVMSWFVDRPTSYQLPAPSVKPSPC